MSCIIKTKKDKIYFKIFENLKIMLNESNIKLDFTKINFMCDFEKSLRNEIIKSFHDSPILKCYFHYIKALIS